MHAEKEKSPRVTNGAALTHLGKTLLAALAAMLVLAGTACGSSEPDTSKEAADIAAAVEKAVSDAAPTGRLTADEVRNIFEESTTSRLSADDVQKIVESSMGQQLTAADVQRILNQSAAGGLTAAEVQKIVDAATSKPLTASDVQKTMNAPVSEAKAAVPALPAQTASPTPSSQLALARLPELTTPSRQPSSQGAPVTGQAAAVAQSPPPGSRPALPQADRPPSARHRPPRSGTTSSPGSSPRLRTACPRSAWTPTAPRSSLP